MATQICPRCNNDSFTWILDEEVSTSTIWHCYSCGYTAYEDESLERICQNCKKLSESRMKDESMEYWWCSNCRSILSP